MKPVDELERAVRELSSEQLAEFRRWFREFDAQIWDAQFERDAASGRLESLAEEALLEHRQGRTRPL
ncbi:MAG: hypothetical protein U0X73_05265 [Thermoanaerobaculia bacterium]